MGKVWVFGSINMDVVAFTPRHPLVGETVMGTELHLLPGGKGANQAVAASRAGATTGLVGRLGADAFARELRAFLEAEAVGLSLTRIVEGVSTGTAIIAVADSDNTIVVVPGANGELPPGAAGEAAISRGDVVVAQFETPQDTTIAAFEVAREAGAITVLNPAPADRPKDGLLLLTDVLVLNESELAALSGRPPVTTMAAEVADSVARDLRVHDDQVIVVTLGAAGAVAVDGALTHRVQGHSVDAVDTTGAGDCFVGNLAASLAVGVDLETALRRANLAASLCVQIIGAGVSMPTRDMVDRAAA